jgi:hypothetical protein
MNTNNEDTATTTGETSTFFITTLSRTFVAIQNQRIRTVLRIKAHVRAKRLTETEAKLLINNLDSRLKADENSIKNDMVKALKTIPLWGEWFQRVKGIGPILAGGTIGETKTIIRFPHISNYWSWAGVGIHDGVADHRQEHIKITWNPHMKVLCWKMGESFAKTGGYLKLVYRDFKADEERKNVPWMAPVNKDLAGLKLHDPDCGLLKLSGDTPARTPGINITKANIEQLLKNCKKDGIDEIEIRRADGHVDQRAKRKTTKLFLGLTYMKWTEMMGLPVSAPYARAMLNHDVVTPAQFLAAEDALRGE